MERYISIRMVNIDHYLDDPGPMDRAFCPFSSTRLNKVPVIRVFGSTPSGQKACLHIHQAYPYFYVPYAIPAHNVEPEQIQREIFEFGNAVNHALSLAQGRNQGINGDQYIAAITLVKGIPFYGYHANPETYLKIHLLNPADKQRMVDILVKGAVNGTSYQPHEAHIPFELQFMMDYNLYGMNWVHLHPARPQPTTTVDDDNNDDDRSVQFSLRFREPMFDEPKTVLMSQSTSDRNGSVSMNEDEYYTAITVPKEMQWGCVGRSSYCELELDTTVMTIGNRLELKQRDIRCHKDLEKEQSQQEKLIKSLAGIWADEANRRAERNVPMPSTNTQDEARDDAQNRQWSTEAAWRRMIDRFTAAMPESTETAGEAGGGDDGNGHDRDALIHSNDIPTTFEAVESLYPPEYYTLSQRSDFSQSRIIPPRLLSNLSDLLRQNSSQEQNGSQASELDPRERQMANASPYSVQAATPSRYRKWQNVAANTPNDSVNADMIHTLVRTTSSFQDDDIPDEDVLALARQYSEQEEEQRQRQVNEEEEGEDIMWPTQSPSRTQQRLPQIQLEYDDERSDLFRPRKLDFHAEVARIEAREAEASKSSAMEEEHSASRSAIMDVDEDDDIELQVSEIPPSPPRTYKRSRYLPQYDGAGDSSSENDDDHNDDNHEIQPIPMEVGRRRPPLPYKEEPYISVKRQPALAQLVLKKRQERANQIRQQQEQQSQRRSLEPLIPEQQHNSKSRSQVYDPGTVEPTCDDTNPKEYVYAHSAPVVSRPDYVSYQEPYYSNPADVPSRPKVFSGKEFRLSSKSVQHLKPVPSKYFDQSKEDEWKHSTITEWELAGKPPSPAEIRQWLLNEEQKKLDANKGDEAEKDKAGDVDKASTTQLDGPSTLGFEFSLSKPKSKVTRARDYLDILSVEIHVNSRDDKLPDPAHDAVQTIFWCLKTEDANIISNGFREGYHVEIITVSLAIDTKKIGLPAYETTYVEDEKTLFQAFIEVVRLYDPDMLVGYELHNASWGYLIERAAVHGIHLIDELARVGAVSDTIHQDQWGYRKASIYRITGRHMVNVWRTMQGEYNLTSYTFENVAYNILHCRMAHYPYRILTAWHTQGEPVLKYRLYKYYLDRVQMNLDLLDVSEIINRTCESARVFGIDFYSVLTRGSQFKVESTMFRIAKPENFVLISPSREQVGRQRAAECLPLVMEPETEFYNSPLLVLDFQSLYPSIMIAYNYCFSTCLGKVRNQGDPPKFGVGELDITPEMLRELKDEINVSPNGIMFVKPSIRKSLLAKMLSEILDTRVMIKTSMKDYKDDTGLLRLLDARQLTLKYIANVTYGYTSASFSGRMPAVEIADSIVQTGRETLERTIAVINEMKKWDAKVVYGDTDSVFVSLPGRTREEAFEIGKDIAQTITAMNPSPVRLKFEKVYHPCVLVAKKRYVGFKYESPEETEPVFEAKGIETVRRDGTMATQKILEASLKILFRTQDMSKLKEYLYRQWTKVLSNRVSVQDFIIAREVRLGTYTEQGLPNGARVALDKMAQDPRNTPQHGERVPYVVVYKGGPGARLRDKVVRPEEILYDNTLQLDAEYYITKMIIPPLARIFNLVGVDVKAWYDEMPRSRKTAAIASARYEIHQQQNKSFKRIDQYYASSHCIICRRLTDENICSTCETNPAQMVYTLRSRQAETESRLVNTLLLCQSCSGISPIQTAATSGEKQAAIDTTGYADHPCDSLDCPVFYERVKAKNDVCATSTYDELL